MSNQFSLLKTNRFLPLFITQFLGAFNDNVFKNALIVLLTFQSAKWTDLSPALLTSLAPGIFILPFFLFSATAGQIADKFPRNELAKFVKLFEVLIMLIAGVGFYFHSFWTLMFTLFLFGLHSTLFGPVKYAILPQHLKEDEIIGGNALVEAGTFIAILLGTVLGGSLASLDDGPMWITVAGIVIAFLGYVSAKKIPLAPAPVPDIKINYNPLTETFRNISFAKKNRAVFLSILAISWFWLYGVIFLSQFPLFAKEIFNGNESVVTMLLVVFTVGIGFGSLICEKISKHQINVGLVPIGAVGLTLFGLDFSYAAYSFSLPNHVTNPQELLGMFSVWRILGDLIGLGFFGGLYCVPLYALLQERSEETHRARIIATNNIMNALFMVIASLGSAFILGQNFGLPMLFAIAAIINALIACYIFSVVPEYLIRFKKLLGFNK